MIAMMKKRISKKPLRNTRKAFFRMTRKNKHLRYRMRESTYIIGYTEGEVSSINLVYSKCTIPLFNLIPIHTIEWYNYPYSEEVDYV